MKKAAYLILFPTTGFLLLFGAGCSSISYTGYASPAHRYWGYPGYHYRDRTYIKSDTVSRKKTDPPKGSIGRPRQMPSRAPKGRPVRARRR